VVSSRFIYSGTHADVRFVRLVLVMPPTTPQKSVFQRQIPTMLGIGVLVLGLIGGVVFMGAGPGIFAPRATPQTTPKNIKITNVTDTGFSVSFLTDEAVAGFIKYGKTADDLKSQASDDRDQLSGSVGKFSMHHITVRGLEPGVPYHFTLGTASNSRFDKDGAPFTVTTAKRGGTPSAAKTIYGSVSTAGGTPADGAVVYVMVAGAGEMSSLVKSSGSWAVPLSNARTTDGAGFAQIKDADSLTLTVQGAKATETATLTTTVGQAQPVPTITFGQEPSAAAPVAPASDSAASDSAAVTTLPSPSPTGASTQTATGGLSELMSSSTSSASATTASASAKTAVASGSATTVDLTKSAQPIITTTTPVITGVAAPGVKVKISVHSDTEIEMELVADSNGGFTLDIAKLSQQLEPGEHTVTYSYTDPTTGKLVTKTQTFTVQAKTGTGGTTSTTKASTSSAKTTTASLPYGSGNPYAMSPSPSALASGSSRVSYPSTRSGVPVSGSAGTTLALLAAGAFFILAGGWSFALAQAVTEETEG
jgi:hypothetical protein